LRFSIVREKIKKTISVNCTNLSEKSLTDLNALVRSYINRLELSKKGALRLKQLNDSSLNAVERVITKQVINSESGVFLAVSLISEDGAKVEFLVQEESSGLNFEF